ncbi:MAG TPA: response regulator transcription factor [Clostridiales bacterium]|jgi:DNA-binding response OmpR family regulator|nr:response regulator transcription factor [Clostridiales bacterium]
MTSKSRILICDTHLELYDKLEPLLPADEYEVVSFSDYSDLLHMVELCCPHLLLVDGVTSSCRCFDLCREISSKYIIPFIIVSEVTDEIEKVICLELGADDYITKPCSPREIVARIKAVLKRYKAKFFEQDMIIRRGSLEINMTNFEVKYDGRYIKLTPKEVKLLQLLVCNPGRVISRREVLKEIWGRENNGHLRVVDSHIKRLRNKFPNTKREWQIKTIYGIGYMFEAWEDNRVQF